MRERPESELGGAEGDETQLAPSADEAWYYLQRNIKVGEGKNGAANDDSDEKVSTDKAMEWYGAEDQRMQLAKEEESDEDTGAVAEVGGVDHSEEEQGDVDDAWEFGPARDWANATKAQKKRWTKRTKQQIYVHQGESELEKMTESGRARRRKRMRDARTLHKVIHGDDVPTPDYLMPLPRKDPPPTRARHVEWAQSSASTSTRVVAELLAAVTAVQLHPSAHVPGVPDGAV